MLEKLMDLLGVAPERTLMIGDTTHDLQMASNARTHALAVTYGAHAPETLAALSPLACLDSFPELMQWLRQNA
jgi:phosphoglycolate phosphatase